MPKLHVKMKDIPKQDRPRERLIEFGSSILSNQELIAILLGSGTRKESVQELASRIYSHFDGVELLRAATLEELTSIQRNGKVKAVSTLAVIEIRNLVNQLIVP